MKTKQVHVDALIKAVNDLPIEAFAHHWDLSSAVEKAIKHRAYNEYNESVHAKKEEKASKDKAQRRLTLVKARHAATIDAIKRGAIDKGTFIKVNGAKDGSGYREIQDIRPRTHYEDDREINSYELICRQWLPIRGNRMLYSKRYSASVCVSFSDGQQVKQIWLEPCDQMTTHQADKLAKVLTRVK